MITHPWESPAKTKAVSQNIKMIERLAKVAEDLARQAGLNGITVTDIRLEAIRRNIIPSVGHRRGFSYLSAVPLTAGLKKTSKYRRSRLRVTHGNLQVVWVHPLVAESPYLNA